MLTQSYVIEIATTYLPKRNYILIIAHRERSNAKKAAGAKVTFVEDKTLSTKFMVRSGMFFERRISSSYTGALVITPTTARFLGLPNILAHQYSSLHNQARRVYDNEFVDSQRAMASKGCIGCKSGRQIGLLPLFGGIIHKTFYPSYRRGQRSNGENPCSPLWKTKLITLPLCQELETLFQEAATVQNHLYFLDNSMTEAHLNIVHSKDKKLYAQRKNLILETIQTYKEEVDPKTSFAEGVIEFLPQPLSFGTSNILVISVELTG